MKAITGLRKLIRTLSAMVALAFAASPGRATAAVVAELLGAVLSLISAYQIRSVVEATSSGRSELAIANGVILAATGGPAWISYLCYAQIAPRVMEAITVHLDADLIRLTARIPTLEYADRPVHADKIALIRGGSQQLAGGLQMVSLNLRMLVSLAGTFIILIGVDPWLALLPLFAIPRALAGQRARRLAVQAQEATAGRSSRSLAR